MQIASMKFYAARLLCISRHAYAVVLGGPWIELHRIFQILCVFFSFMLSFIPSYALLCCLMMPQIRDRRWGNGGGETEGGETRVGFTVVIFLVAARRTAALQRTECAPDRPMFRGALRFFLNCRCLPPAAEREGNLYLFPAPLSAHAG